MRVLGSVRIAFRALRVNKLRSALTMLGVVIGIAAVVTMVAHPIADFAQWRVLLRRETVLIAVGVAAAVGVGFALYPAREAARLHPIDALRFE